MRHRLLTTVVTLCAAVLVANCGGSSSTPPTVANTELCEWLTPTVPGGACSAVDPWKSVSSWQREQRELDIAWLNISNPGADPAEVAADQDKLGFQPPGRTDLPRWPLKFPLDWNADPFGDGNWRFQLNAWRMIDTLMLAWQQTGEASYAEGALRIIDDWHRYHIEERRRSYYGWGDMATGLRAMKLAWFLDQALRGAIDLDAPRRSRLLALADRHVQVLRTEGFIAESNHGFFQTHGLLALCRTVPYLASCEGAIDYAELATEKLLRSQFTAEGGHREHSPAYHMFVADLVKRMLRTGWYEGFTEVRALVDRVEANRVWMYHPDGKVVLVGDSEREGGPITFPTGTVGCEAGERLPGDCYRLRVLRETGYAIARSDWAVPVESSSMLFLTAAFHSANHKHADDLSFELFDHGELILSDTGKYKYDQDPWRDFALSSRAHNTLEINGVSSSISPHNAYGSGVTTAVLNNGKFRFVAEAPQSDTGRTHRRQLHYTPRRSLLVIDQVDGPAPTSTTQWFHFAPQVDVAPADADGRFVARLGSGRQIHVERILPGCPGRLYRGQDEPFIQGWTSKSYGVLVPRSSVGFHCDRPAPAYVTLFILDPAQADAVREEAQGVLRSLGLL